VDSTWATAKKRAVSRAIFERSSRISLVGETRAGGAQLNADDMQRSTSDGINLSIDQP
jgi:hypothetical protein